ncbi:hypothetical protein BGX21_007321 [Mortierella sp. AD011]|nr:hypothetical protein BGX20_001416 [Mortierella sp. AD010]KAF9398754.1 hypothetical protein BGX21_007321 [Mortierella sp. AD011]
MTIILLVHRLHRTIDLKEALAPTTSASTGVPPAPGSASNGATNPHPEHRAVKTEHAHQEALRRNAALLDERPAKIKIVQQPLHARMCGFGEKDRRPVDPPPIVQLILDEDHEQHPTKRMQRNAAKKAAGDSKDKPEDNKEGENGGKEGEDETDQLEEDGNEEKQPDGTATGKTAAKGKAGSLQKQDSQDAASGAGSSPSLGKRSRPSSNSKSKAKRSGTADDGDDGDGEKSHSDHSQSGSDDEGDDDNNQHTNGNLQEQDPLFVLHVSLWSADGKEVRNMIATPGQSEPPKLTRILMGSLVVSPILLNNPEGVPGWYFSFPDLSIRTEGVYTLKFSLMRFGSFDFMSNDGGHASTLVAEEISEPFTVFSAKKFPGMTESTELSKAFAKQGLKIPIRNDLRARKADRDN